MKISIVIPAYNEASGSRPALIVRQRASRHEDMERAAYLSNELPRRRGPSPQARWDARAVITPEARAAFLETLQEERLQVLEDLGLSGKPELSTLEHRQVERHSIRRALVATGGRRIEAAQLLGIGRNTITRKIQELGIDDGKE